MEVVLDSSFIVSCVKQKIDFVEQLRDLGFDKIAVPRDVLQELKDLRLRTRREEKEAIEIALKLIENTDLVSGGLGGRNVDEGLIAEGRKGVYIATLDREVKKHSPNKVVIHTAQNRIGIERD